MKPKIPKRKQRHAPEVVDDDGNKEESSRYIGVTYRSRRKKYQARMYRGSHEYNLGLFDLAADAALAYDAAHRVAGGKVSLSNVPSKSSKDGCAATSLADEEEIKYALDWIDCADDMERPQGLAEDDPMHLNFLHPSDFRQAREREIFAYKDKNINSDSSEEDVELPTESELKLRMKQEILNIAKTYVSQQVISLGPPDDGSDLTFSNDDEEGECSNQTQSQNDTEAQGMGSGPTKKRTFQHINMSSQYEDCHEEAETLLSLNRRKSKESKQAARAQKLMEFMAGDNAKTDGAGAQASSLNQNLSSTEERKQSSSDAEIIQQQLQENLARQQAMTIDSFNGSFNQQALMSSLLGQYSLEQVLLFARERPDLVNEETILEFVRNQRTGMSQQLVNDSNQADLLYAQLQAAMMTGGHFNPTQLPMGMQGANNSGGRHIQQNNLGDRLNGSGHQDGQTTDSKPSHESPFLMKVLEEYKKQEAVNQDQAALQKKISNEARRAALAQKLSVHLSNESNASIASGKNKADENKRSCIPASFQESASESGRAINGDSENKVKSASSNAKDDNVEKNEVNSSVGIVKDSNEVKEVEQVPQDLGSFAGLRQSFNPLQTIDPFQKTIIQHTMVNGEQLQNSQPLGGRNASELAAQDFAFRLQQQLMNEEYRLQQLRLSLQNQVFSQYLHRGGLGALNGMASNNSFPGGHANSLMQLSMNNNNQEMLLQQALALRANQNASLGGGDLQSQGSQGRAEHMLLAAAQSQGIDAGALAQLLNQRGLSQPPSSGSEKN